MRRLTTCFLALLFSTAAFAQEATEAEVRKLRAVVKRQEKEIKELKTKIASLQEKTVKKQEEKRKIGDRDEGEEDTVCVYLGCKRTKQWFDKMYAQFHDKIALIDGKYYDIGKQKLRLEALVLQDKMRIQPFKPFGGRGKPPRKVGLYEYLGGVRFGNPKVLQILGPKEMLVAGHRIYHIRGIPTENLVTGDSFFAWVVYVGTYQYVTVEGGSTTVASYQAYQPLTKAQFKDALANGFKLVEYRFRQVNPDKSDPNWHHDIIAWHEKRHGKSYLVYNKVVSLPVRWNK